VRGGGEEDGLPALSRRAFLRAGAAVAAVAAVGGPVSIGRIRRAEAAIAPPPAPVAVPVPPPLGASADAPTRHTFRSRPDLTPPIIHVTGSAAAVAPGLIFLTPFNGVSPDGPMIVDDAGAPVWLRPDGGTLRATDAKVQTYHGEPVLTWWEGEGLVGYGHGTYVLADTSYREIARVRAVGDDLAGDLHDMKLTPDGTALFFCYSTVPGQVVTMRGVAEGPVTEAVVQEIDVATGKLLFEWHSLDHVDVLESFLPMTKGPAEAYDYFHANSVDLGSDGNLLLSSRHTWTVYDIDRGTGRIVWRLGGSRSDFELGPGVRFAWQHDAKWRSDGTMTIYDNGAHGPAPQFESASRGLHLALDHAAMRATLLQDWVHPDGLLSASQGTCELLPNGDAFLGFGNIGRYSEFDGSGKMLYDARLAIGASYRATRREWQASPDDAPAVAVDVSGTTPTLYASWNGATDVAAWSVSAGSSPDALAFVTTAPRTGFETEIKLPLAAAWVAVRAMSADGRMLGGAGPLAVG
jgi:hypothetical protein